MAKPSLREQAIGFLARREYSRSELEQRLLAKGGERGAICAVLDALVAEGYLSDVRYARAVVAQRSGSHSRRRIVAGLRAMGVGREDIDSAVAETGLDDDAALRALWQRRFGEVPADERAKARQVRFLQARGFSLSAILKLLRSRDASGSDRSR